MIKNKFKFGMFFLLAFLVAGLVAASYSSSNPNYGLFKKYDSSSSSYVDGNNICSAGQDFVLQISPTGCIPTIVRSDLLEEQNVPVFCAISATQVNPLVDVESIESMSFSGEYPAEVSGIGFHPAQAALGTTKQTNYAVLENIGYVVVVLKQQKNESDMPDFVEGDLVAKLTYDVDNAYGLGDSSFYLPELSESEFEQEQVKNKYGFWGGQFYLRAEKIEENYATISIYQDTGKIASVTLEKGDTSNEISMPGFDCLARLKLKLEALENPGTTVQLRINGDVIEVVESQKFLDNNCQITDVDKQGLVQKVQIKCYEDEGRKSFNLNVVPSLSISVGDESYVAEYGEEIGNTGITFTGIETKKNSKEISDVQVTLTYSSTKYILTKSKGATINGQNVVLNGYAEEKNSDLSGDALEYYEKAVEDYDSLSNSFGSQEYSSSMTYAQYALQQKIELASAMGQMKTFSELCENYKSDFGKEYTRCESVVALSSTGKTSASVLINGETSDISLVEISDSDFDQYGAKVVVDKVTYELEKNKIVYLEGSNNKEFLQMTEIKDEDEVKVKVYLKKEGSSDYVNSVQTLKKDSAESFGTSHKITLSSVNLEKYAKVSVVSSVDNTGTSANFSFKIGIEKRAIQLSTDEIQDKIESLNETIEKWTEYKDSLGNVVKTMKGACLATGGFLIAKNFLFNQGESLVRAEVTSVWNTKCTNHMAGTEKIAGKENEKYASLDACLADNSEEIDAEVSAAAKIKEETSDTFSSLQEGITTTSWAGLENVVDDDALWEKLTDSTLLKELQSDLEKCYGEGDSIKINDKTSVSASEIVSRIKKDYTTITNVRDMISYAEMCASGYEDVAKSKLDPLLATLYTASQSDENKKTLASSVGWDANDVTLVAEKDATAYTYQEETYADVKDKVTIENVDDSNPISKILTTAGKTYVAVLKKSGNKYVITQLYDMGGNKVSDSSIKAYFVDSDGTSYQNKFISTKGATTVQIRYYETEPNKGKPAMVPFNLKDGWYVYVNQDTDSYDDSSAVRNYYLCNVGANGKEEAKKNPDDSCRTINKGTGQTYTNFAGLEESEVKKLVKCAESAVTQATRQYSGSGEVTIKTDCGGTIKLKRGSPETSVPSVQCQNYMSPSDCQLLFNVCDPVLCPSSRCDFGGTYAVSDVIQSGIIGGIFLCLPNWVGVGGDVYIPFCLSGIHAGIEGLVSIYESYRDCLQEKLDSGATVGVCDEIYSIYLCEFLWEQALPLAEYSLPKIIEALSGHSTRGGGEYLSFSNAWKTASESIDYFTNYYGGSSSLFKVTSTEEVGTEICQNYISGVGPDISSMLDSATDPDSPVQFHGWFEEEEYTTATVPATSQYKVYYHIYAGDEDSAYYQVYLKGGSESSYYQDTTSTRLVDSGYISAGEYVSETKDFLTTAGYTKLCIRVNNQEECGFKEVSTSAAVDYVTDAYVASIADDYNISSEDECISGTLLQSLTESEAYEYGIIRICATDNPGTGTDAKAGTEDSRWKQVGWCEEDNKIACWLDTESVEDAISTGSLKDSVLETVTEYYLGQLQDSTEVTGAENAIDGLDNENNAETIVETVNKYIDKLIMVDYKIKALRLRANAYAELAKGKYTDKIEDSSGSTCGALCKEKGFDNAETIYSETSADVKIASLEDGVASKWYEEEDCFCWNEE